MVHFKTRKYVDFIPVAFYKTSLGREPVREWLQGLSKHDRKTLGNDLHTIQYGWPPGMPLSRNLKEGLWEMRSNLESNRISRMIFCTHDNSIVLLHGFIKKTGQTPRADLELARSRKKEVRQ